MGLVNLLASWKGFEPLTHGLEDHTLVHHFVHHFHKRSPRLAPGALILLASWKGFEPLTHGLEGRCSIQLSYQDMQYELITNKDHAILPHDSQGNWMVGAAGFEPATPWSQARCATKLRYAPSTQPLYYHELCASVNNDILAGSQMSSGRPASKTWPPALILSQPIIYLFSPVMLYWRESSPDRY